MGLEKKIIEKKNYKKFDKLDGSHPLKQVVPEGHVDYEARIRKGGKIRYFNFSLAKEMGLISKDHSDELNEDLTRKIYETFSIQIINEFDKMNGRKYPEKEMKSGTYMATRYLQLQHEDKKGRTSGDGRSVWNGQIKNKGRVWDVSSGGTGGTCLSPATSKYNRFFETGDPSISYGCGYAEFDEGMATAILSEIFKLNGLKTEETLTVIEYENNISINVRASENLLRPSHFFLYLKQSKLDQLRSLTDYYIDQMISTKKWRDVPVGNEKYDYFLDKMCETFSEIAAKFEDQYIFCWLDWDGDNILMDGGIIDYGSIRQFGMFHYEYRYDDVERFSTSLLEQKGKAKCILQNFSQAVDYLKTGEKKSLSNYSNDNISKKFEVHFELEKNKNLLNKIGFSEKQSKQLIKRYKYDVEEFRKVFSYFEKMKSKKGEIKVSDGVSWDVIYNMRDLLREYPQIRLSREDKISNLEFLEIMTSRYAEEEDLEINKYKESKIECFQVLYHNLFLKCAKLFQIDVWELYLGASQRSQYINKPNRVTGDAATLIVDLLMQKKSKLNSNEIYEIIQDLVASQNLNPEKRAIFIQKEPKGLLKEMIEIIKDNREGL